MKIALLVCDHVKQEFVEQHGDYPSMFGQLLPQLSMEPWMVCDGNFPDVDAYDGFIATGSRLSVYEELDWIQRLKELTREMYAKQKKFVGVCFGHQLIAEALGGKVEKAPVGYLVGAHAFMIKRNLPWNSDHADTFNILMLCQDQVSQLPPHSTVYATSKECPVGMLTVGHHFLGIQGHPEFSKAYNQAVFSSRPDQIAEEKIAGAIRSFENEVDTQWLRNVITEFLHQ